MDRDKVKAWWDDWPRERYVVLTAISRDKKQIDTCTFDREKQGKGDELVAWVKRYNESLEWNVYFTLNPVIGLVNKKPEREQIAAMTWLHVDCDPRAGEDIEEEQRRILSLLQNPPDGIPEPTAIVFSGGGYQAYWRLKEPVPIQGEKAKYEDAALYNKALELKLGGDNCHNIDRLMRLPGTTNWPDERKRKKGREQKLAETVEFNPERTYDISQFKKTPTLPLPTHNAQVDAANIVRIEDVSDLGDKVSDLCKVVIVQGNDPDNPDRFPSRSEALFYVVCELARAGVRDQVIFNVITDRGFKISESVLDKGRNVEGYAKRQIERAREASQDLDKDEKGRVYSSIINVRRVLTKMGVRLFYDEFADRPIIEGLSGFPPVLQDDAVNHLWLRAEEDHKLVIGKDRFFSIVADFARREIRNPVQEYLASLEWDNKHRLDTWLPRYLSASDTPYSRAVGRIVLVAAVRRARQPGCKFDEMLVLEGKQGTGKSEALKILAVQDDWFTEDLILNADTKKQIEQISGKWIVEAGELKGMRNRQTEFLKSFLSRQIDRARMSYGRLVKEYPRRCVIIGTTNDDSYLRDETGNRRFWPIKTDRLDIKALRADRDQLWAEATHAEANGESIRLDPALWGEAAREQDERRERDPWADELERLLGDRQGKVSRNALWQWLGHENGSTIGQDDGRRLSAAMRELGFEREKRMHFKGCERPWPGFWRGHKDSEISEGGPF